MPSDVNLLLCGAPRPRHAHRSGVCGISGVLTVRSSTCRALRPALSATSYKQETTSH